jgi:hypothetical protein
MQFSPHIHRSAILMALHSVSLPRPTGLSAFLFSVGSNQKSWFPAINTYFFRWGGLISILSEVSFSFQLN